MDFFDVIKSRRSIRIYDDRPVEDEKLNNILESARLAPSWANKQCWSFIVIKDKKTIIEISKTTLVNNWLKKAPVIIVACGDPMLSGVRNGMDYYLVDVAIAMEHVLLTATDLGLGTCWIGAFNEGKIKNILSIPNDIKVVALTPVGYQGEKDNLRDKVTRSVLKPTRRKALTEIVHYDAW